MDLNDLELLIKSPKDYICKYFNDLRETITNIYKMKKETKQAIIGLLILIIIFALIQDPNVP